MRRSPRVVTSVILSVAVIMGLSWRIAPADAQPARLAWDTTRVFQRIEGWGGHVYPQSWKYHAADSSYERKLFEELDVTHFRLRSVWYLLEATNDNDDPSQIDLDALARADTGLVHDELLLQQRLAQKGKVLQFAAWRFPYWMAGESADWNPQFDDKPPITPEMEPEFVESIAAYLLYARDRYGIVFDAVSIANEPDLGIYIPGLTPERLLRLTARLRDRLNAEGYQTDANGRTRTRFYMPDVAAADSIGLDYVSRFFDLRDATDVASALSYHTYRRDTGVMSEFATLADRAGIPVWAMEMSHTHLAAADRFEWSHALANAICQYDALVYSNASLSVYWAFSFGTSRGLGIYVPEKKAWTPSYDMLKHFFNYVPVGSHRIDVSLLTTAAAASDPWRDDATAHVKAVGFLRPDGSVVLIAINTGGVPFEIAVDGDTENIEATASDPLWRGYELKATPVNAGSLIGLPARSIVTIEVVR
ncbi:MAG: glycoside hydrolase family 30 beta sandwich domain-containing protein [Rhodothermales bacterium]